MEILSLAYEESFLRPVRVGENPCFYGRECLGSTLCTYEGYSFKTPLPELLTPQGVSFSQRCVLCLRRDVTRTFYRVLKDRDLPQTDTIHPYVVRTDAPGEYNLDVCLCAPSHPYRFVGLVGAFPRYDPLSLVCVEGTWSQRGVQYVSVPTFHARSARQGARTLDFFPRTSMALLFAGWLCDVEEPYTLPVIDVYRKAYPRKNMRVYLHDYPDLHDWLSQIVQWTYEGRYPHCVHHGTLPVDPLTEITLCVQEHIVFLLQLDEELRAAVIRKFPKYPRFAEHTKQCCDGLRMNQLISKDRVYAEDMETNYTQHMLGLLPWEIHTTPPAHNQVYERLRNKPVLLKEMEQLPFALRQELHRTMGWLLYAHLYSPIPLPPSMHQAPKLGYVCPTCRSFKSQMVTNNEFSGHVFLAMDWGSREVYCKNKHLQGRKPTLKQIHKRREAGEVVKTVETKNRCTQPLVHIVLGTHMCHVNGICMTICTGCRRVMNFSVFHSLCESCQNPVHQIGCAVCHTTKPKNTKSVWTSHQAFQDGGYSGCRTYWFCKDHSFLSTNQIKYWSYPLLLARVDEVYTNKKKLKMR